jgi:hypothetical protein
MPCPVIHFLKVEHAFTRRNNKFGITMFSYNNKVYKTMAKNPGTPVQNKCLYFLFVLCQVHLFSVCT